MTAWCNEPRLLVLLSPETIKSFRMARSKPLIERKLKDPMHMRTAAGHSSRGELLLGMDWIEQLANFNISERWARNFVNKILLSFLQLPKRKSHLKLSIVDFSFAIVLIWFGPDGSNVNSPRGTSAHGLLQHFATPSFLASYTSSTTTTNYNQPQLHAITTCDTNSPLWLIWLF